MKHAATILSVVAILAVAGCQPKTQVTGPQTIEIGYPPAPPLGDFQAPEATAEGPADLPPPPAVPSAPGGPVTEVTDPPPPPPPAPPAPQVRVHVVQPNETVWKISGIYYGESSRANVAKIAQANPGLNPEQIKPGQKIVIPD